MLNFSELTDDDIKKMIATLEVSKADSGLEKLVEAIFKEFDVDKNGVLDRKEMRLFLGKIFTEWKFVIPHTDEFLDDIFQDIDKDHNSKITPIELKLYLAKDLGHILSTCYAELSKRAAH